MPARSRDRAEARLTHLETPELDESLRTRQLSDDPFRLLPGDRGADRARPGHRADIEVEPDLGAALTPDAPARGFSVKQEEPVAPGAVGLPRRLGESASPVAYDDLNGVANQGHIYLD